MCFSPTGLISRAAASEKRLAAPLCHFWPPFTAAGGGGGGRQQQVMTVGLDQDQVSLLGVITPQSLARSLICSNKDLFQDAGCASSSVLSRAAVLSQAFSHSFKPTGACGAANIDPVEPQSHRQTQ